MQPKNDENDYFSFQVFLNIEIIDMGKMASVIVKNVGVG